MAYYLRKMPLLWCLLHQSQRRQRLVPLDLRVLRDRKERRVKLVWWVVLGLLGWLAFLATLVLLAWLVRPGPPARPVPAARLDSEERKAYRASKEQEDRLAHLVKLDRWVHLDHQGSRVYLDPPVRSIPSSCVHLDSQGDLSC